MNTRSFFYLGVVSSLVTSTTTFFSCEQKSEKAEHHESHLEIAELMFHNQRYMEKLYFAGKKQNWKLADFYHHELEENMEKLIEGDAMEDGVNLSKLAQSMFVPASNTLKEAIVAKDTALFTNGLTTMVSTCNNCHFASKHEFIKIINPKEPAYSNQQY